METDSTPGAGSETQTEASTAPRRGRGRLGRGLGALIPTVEPTPEQGSSRPLDILFPDLTGSQHPGTGKVVRPRGGSARDLLAPRTATQNVSRETSAASSNQAGNSGQTGGLLTDESSAAEPTQDILKTVPGTSFGSVDPGWIIPNLKQPRTVFDPADLAELAASLAEVGMLQPIVLRPITAATRSEAGQESRLRDALAAQPDARYELVMGERRWRAAQVAGMAEIPAIIRTTAEDDLLRDALLENLHRVQLNALEEAAAYSQLLEDFGCTQEELSTKIARSRPQIANTLRLLKLPASVQRQVAAGVLSAGHARALLGLESAAAMESLAARIIAEGLSVRATEEQVKFGKQSRPRAAKTPQAVTPAAQAVVDAVSELLDTTVTVSTSAKRGRLIIEFAGQDDLDRIAAVLGAL